MIISVVLLLFLLLITGFILAIFCRALGKPFLEIILMPPFFFLTTFVYLLIKIKFFDTSFETADKIYTYTLWVFFIFGFAMFSGGMEPTHKTKSGKADKRYKNNEPVNADSAAYMLGVIIVCGIALFVMKKFTNITMIGLLQSVLT